MSLINLRNTLYYHFTFQLFNLPTPSNLSFIWNGGSLLGLCLISQIITGLFLSFHFVSDSDSAFESVINLSRDTIFGWWLRFMHVNGASLFFICLFFHLARGLYYKSYIFPRTWLRGIILLVLIIATSFLGYVLPWGQISFWGATVITNLVRVIPYLGQELVSWVWGGFRVGQRTLIRFFSLHFITPFIILACTLIHLIALHSTGSSNPLGLSSNYDKVPFHPYFTYKDITGFIFVFILFHTLVFIYPWWLGDSENFILANPIITPTHIKPEWYFLFAYAILRRVPNKTGGVLGLVISIIILGINPLLAPISKVNPTSRKIIFWLFISSFLILTWIGGIPVEYPFYSLGQVFSLLYFCFSIILSLI